MKTLCTGLILNLFLLTLLQADDLMAPSTESKPKKLHYLSLSKEDQLKLVPSAPVKDSDQDKSDLAGVLKAQAGRTPDQQADATKFQKFDITLVTEVIGADFTAAHNPVSFILIKNAQNDVYIITGTLKDTYKRNRPYVDHPEVKSLFTAKSFSYPSGHASGSRLLADILILLFPDKKQALLDRAAAIAESRVIAGVHYPSDIEQGTVLGDKVAALLEANPAFQKDLTAAQAELKK